MGFWTRLTSWIDATPPNLIADGRHLGIEAFDSLSLGDPRLPEFLRGGYANSSGRPVTERGALRNATFFRATNLISSAIGMLPLNLHQMKANGDREKAKDHPVYRLLRQRPNGYQTPLEFKAYMQGRALLHGNAYAYKVKSAGKIVALVPMDPCKVDASLGDDWRMSYKWTRKNGGIVTLSADEVFHLRAPFSSDGVTGEGLLKVAAEALGLAGAADDAAARLLRNGAYVGGVLQHPKSLSQPAIDRLRQQFEERHSGTENAGKWLVAEEGLEAKPFGMSGRDAQGLEQRKHQAEEVSRYTGVPRPLLMFDETSWGSGIEQLGLFFVTYCLLPWFVAWEEAISRDLLTEAESRTLFAKFKEAALLRGSLKDQAEFFAKALGGPGAAGFMVPNEAREKMDMNHIADGDKPAWGAQSPAEGGANGA